MRFLCHTAHTPHLTIVTDFLSLQAHYSHPEILFSHLIEKKFSPHENTVPFMPFSLFSAGMPHSYGSAVSGLLCRQAFRARKHTARITRWDRNLPAQGNGCGTEKGRLTGWRAVKGERKSRKKCRGGRTTEVSAHPPVFPAKQERGTSASVWDSTPPLRTRKRLGGANAIPTDAVDYGRKRWATV